MANYPDLPWKGKKGAATYMLEGSPGEHEPHVIGKLVARTVPGEEALKILAISGGCIGV